MELEEWAFTGRGGKVGRLCEGVVALKRKCVPPLQRRSWHQSGSWWETSNYTLFLLFLTGVAYSALHRGAFCFTFHSSCTHLSVSDTAAGQDGGLCDGVKLKKRAARRWASWRRTSHRRRMRRRCRRWRWPAATWRWTTHLCRTNLHGIKNVSCWCGKTPDWWGGIFAPTKNWLVDKGAWDLFSMKREPISHLPGQEYFLAFEIFLNWNHLHTNEMLPLQTKYWILTRDFKK